MVSIPLWCDWNDTAAMLSKYLHMFQFHYGAIGTKLLLNTSLNDITFQFHYSAIGTMRLTCRPAQYEVSIPLWCDWNYSADTKAQKSIMFQFHYGAIGTILCLMQMKHFLLSFNSIMVRLELPESAGVLYIA